MPKTLRSRKHLVQIKYRLMLFKKAVFCQARFIPLFQTYISATVLNMINHHVANLTNEHFSALSDNFVNAWCT